MATVATIAVNFASYGSTSFTPAGVLDRSINPLTLAQYCQGGATVDNSYIGGFVRKGAGGDTMLGMLLLPSTNPTNDNHAARKGYVDSRITSLSSTVVSTGDDGFVRIIGSTMTGMLTLPSTNPTNINHSTRKGYVDSRVDSLSAQVNIILTGSETTNPTSNSYLPRSGGQMDGNIAMSNNKITGLPSTGLTTNDAVPKIYVDSAITAALGGGTGGDPNAAYVNKQYVDTTFVKIDGTSTMTGNLTISNGTPTVFLSDTLNTRSSILRGVANSFYVYRSTTSSRTNIDATLIPFQVALNTGNITAAGDIIAYSDERLKTNVVSIENALEKTLKLEGVSFERVDSGSKSIGLIAQKVKEVLPEVVTEDSRGYLGISYGNIVGLLVEAIKELSNKVEDLEKQLNKS